MAGKRVLDVGCSFGRHLLGMTLHGARGVGIELQDTYLRLSRVFAAQLGIGSLAVARARAEHLPFRPASFDVVFCRNVLIYFDDASRLAAARLLFDALNPGGFLCLGHTESMARISDLFAVRRFGDAVVYQRPPVA